MRTRVTRSVVGIATAAAMAVVTTVAGRGGAAAQAPGASQFPRTAWDKKPDLNGIWQVMNTANWNLEDHEATQSPILVAGVWGAIDPGLSVVEGGTIPYRPDALKQRELNRKNAVPGTTGRYLTADPEYNCFLPGVPRATYLGRPFEIFQGPNRMWIVYQYSYARREIFMNGKEEAPVDSWMGWSNAKWDGDTLVVDVTGLMDTSWLDRAGNYHSDQLHVVERYTPVDATHINYEATIEDPSVFTRPWKISMPLYKRIDKDVRILEFKCTEFVEELFWGEYRKPMTGTVPPRGRGAVEQ
jgi:hypothetical protein